MFYHSAGVKEEYETQHTFITWQQNCKTDVYRLMTMDLHEVIRLSEVGKD